jgi:hypothetical protein
MPRTWYGNAQSAKTANRAHNGALSQSAVGGVNSRSGMHSVTVDPRTCRAVYGSTDRAGGDYRNSVLSRALEIDKAAKLHEQRHYEGPAYTSNVCRYAPGTWTEVRPVVQDSNESAPNSAPSQADIAWLVQRATARHMTLVEYARLIGVSLD